jgi:digalactosyldiacylglycerol synthase
VNESENSKARFSKGAYYLGKMVWGKGYRELVDLLAQNKDVLENDFS